MTSTHWDELGIEISVVPEERADEAIQFMFDHFYPDEPISRSLGFGQPGGGTPKIIKWILSYLYKNEAIKQGTSLMATDKDGKMIGLRLGAKQIKKKALFQYKILEWYAWLLPFFVWEFLFGKIAHSLRLMREVGTMPPAKTFQLLGCEQFYEGFSVVVAKDARVRGLGTELVRRSMELAENHGCEYMHIMATGEYSSKIFFRLNFTLENEYEYKNFKDFDGNTLLNDTREHKYGRVFYIKLSNKDEKEKKND